MAILDKYGNTYLPTAQMPRARNKTNSSQAIARIANTFRDRSIKDIDQWRRAIQMAEHPTTPNRQPLQDLYVDLRTDGHLISQMGLRTDSVLNTSFHILNQSTSEIDPELTKWINSKWVYDILKICMDTLYYGHSLIEIDELINNRLKFQIVPRRNVVPPLHRIWLDYTKPNHFIDYTDEVYSPWMIEIGEREDLGLLNNVIPQLIWKRNMQQSWAEFGERFGIPMVTATTTRNTAEAIAEIEEMLQSLGEAAYGVFPEGTQIDFKEASRTDAYMVFSKKIELCNSEISKLLVGGTMISDNGSSKSQSETHAENLNKKISVSDRREITFFFNDVLFPKLRELGLFIDPMFEFTFDNTQEISIEEHWKITNDLMQNPSVEVDYKWVSKRFNVPFTALKKKTPDMKLTSFHDRYTMTCSCNNSINAVGLDQVKLNALTDQLIQLIFDNEETLSISAALIVEEVNLLKSGLMSGYGDRLVEALWNEPDHLMLSMMELNLFDFSTSKVEARLASMSDLLINKETNAVRSFSEFKQECNDLYYNSNWLKTEYNLSVATGQNSAAFIRAEAEQDDFPYVEYFTAGDGNVRNPHAVLNHRIFNLNDAEARKIWPPNGHGCRCEQTQYAHKPAQGEAMRGKDAVALLGADFKDSAFYVNRGDVKKIFLDDQFYKSEKGIKDQLSAMTYIDWELASIEDLKKNYSAIQLDDSITGENVKDFFKPAIGSKGLVMEVFDYINRRLTLSKKAFNTHTQGKYLTDQQKRHQLFPLALDVIANPHEVWLAERMLPSKQFTMTYLKYFEDMVLVVDTIYGQRGMEIVTWFPLKAKEEIKRNGLLIRNKP
jgi:phage gp29-like protein